MSDLTQTLIRLWEEARPVVADQVRALEDAALAALDGSLAAGGRKEAERSAHRLAGSLGTFGFHEGSRLARDAEGLLGGSEPIQGDAVLRLCELVDGVRAEASRSFSAPEATGAEVAGSGAGDTPLVLVVDGDGDIRRRLAEAAVPAGFRAVTAADVPAARDVVAVEAPAMAVIDPLTAGDPQMDFVRELARRAPPVTVVVVSDPSGGIDRAAIARAGGRTFIEKPRSPAAVMEAASRTFLRLGPGASVLVVGDVGAEVERLGAVLEPRGVRTLGVASTEHLLSELATRRPDVLVIHGADPAVDGPALCRILRNDEAWARLPVVMLSPGAGDDDARVAFEAGADDHVGAGVSPEELAMRVLNRLERSRTLTDLTEVDRSSGLANTRGFLRQSGRLLDLARRESRPLAVAVLGADAAVPGDLLAGVIVGEVLTGLARAVRSTLASSDVAGLLVDHRVAVSIYGRPLPDVIERLGGVLDMLRTELNDAPAASASAGVALYPDDGADLDALVHAAMATQADVAAAGGGRVRVSSDRRSADRPVVDVLVVDDDDALGPLLLHALGTRGYSTRWVRDGVEAARLLEDATFRARVVLLDIGLSGLDGLALLRSMNRLGRLGDTKVVMLTLRSTEAEVLASLELGAFDHVAKPFSLPVLLHRVRLAMESLTS